MANNNNESLEVCLSGQGVETKHCLKQTYGARLAAVTDGGKGVMCSAVIQLDLLFRENVRIESFGKPGSTPAERTRQQANHQKSTHAQRRRQTG